MDIPIKKNDVVEGEILDISHLGMGVAKIDGFTVFVDGGLIGDKCRIKIYDVKKSYGLGKAIDVIEPSKYRIKPSCSISHLCGGCQFQEIDYDEQLNIKTNKVMNDIKKIGGLEDVIIHKAIGMKEPYRYRNKAQFPVGSKDDENLIGFYRRESHEIIDTDSCIIQHEINDRIIKVLREFMIRYKIKGYNERTGEGLIRHVLTKTSFLNNDLMIIIVTSQKKLPYKEELINALKKSFPELKSLIQNVNTRTNSQSLEGKMITLYGDYKIVDYVGDLKFDISPQSFFQVNPIQTELLYNKALEYAALKGNETVFDLYCGIGTISLFLAKKAKKVYGIEVVKEAVLDAKENARINNITNVEFYDGEAENVFKELYDDGIRADVVVVDPPRKGCDKSVLETIVKMQPQKVVYVSCNPSTLARDLKYLDTRGYKTVEIQPVDMFPHTVHVEAVTLLRRKNEL